MFHALSDMQIQFLSVFHDFLSIARSALVFLMDYLPCLVASRARNLYLLEHTYLSQQHGLIMRMYKKTREKSVAEL